MATSKDKKVIKLNIMGLYHWESEHCSIKEAIMFLVVSMIFIIVLLIIIKIYALPVFMGGNLLKNGLMLFGKIKKSRAP